MQRAEAASCLTVSVITVAVIFFVLLLSNVGLEIGGVVVLSRIEKQLHRLTGDENGNPSSSAQRIKVGNSGCRQVATTDRATLNYLRGATIDLNGCDVAREDGHAWLPLGTLAQIHDDDSSFADYNFELVPIVSAGFWNTSDPQAVPVSGTFTGPAAARKMCISAFDFTLGAGDFFMFSDIESVKAFPAAGLPASANYVAFPLGGVVFGHLYRDGSLRVTGRNGAPLLPGHYVIGAACVVYQTIRNQQIAPVNFVISNCSSYANVPSTVNRQTFAGQLYEYDDAVFYNGEIHVTACENCFLASNRATNPGLTSDATMLMTYHHFSSRGIRIGQTNPVAINPVFNVNSSCALTYKNLHRASRRHNCNQQEPGLCRTRNGTLIALFNDGMGTRVQYGNNAVYRSTDSGVTWSLDDTVMWAIGAPSEFPQYPFAAYRQRVKFHNGTVLPLDAVPAELENGTFLAPGTNLTSDVIILEEIVGLGPNPNGAGDNRCYTAADGTIWLSGLARHTKYPYRDAATYQQAMSWNAYSKDDGQTWHLAGILYPTDGTAYSYDYPFGATGKDAAGTGTAFWVAIKVDATISELILYGYKDDVELNVFHIPAGSDGNVRQLSRINVPGSKIGGYGNMDTSPVDGTAYVVGAGACGADVDPLDSTNVLGDVCSPETGTCPSIGGLVYISKCTPPPNVVCGMSTIVARTDFATPAPNAQAVRSTLTMPSVAVDKNDVVYILYPDLAPQGPTSIDQNNDVFGGINRQATLLYLIKSNDKGKTWSTPRIINDDTYYPDDPSQDATKFRQLLRYDPVTHALAIIWTDTRDDMSGAAVTTRRYGAVIPL